MLSIFFHLALMLALLWYQKRSAYRPTPLKLSLAWYLAGAGVVIAESYAITRMSFSFLLLQSVVLEALYAVAAWFAFRYAAIKKKGIARPFLAFIGYGLVATAVAGFLLANANFVSGFSR